MDFREKLDLIFMMNIGRLEIALERGYQNIDMIEYIGRLLLQIITVINPYKLYLYP